MPSSNATSVILIPVNSESLAPVSNKKYMSALFLGIGYYQPGLGLFDLKGNQRAGLDYLFKYCPVEEVLKYNEIVVDY